MKLKTLNEMLTATEHLLDFVQVPETALDLSDEILKQAIIRRCGDVEPYYQDPMQFTMFGLLWFNSHGFLFDHALSILNASYNPIENYDRNESETINDTSTGTRSGTDTHSGTDTTTTTGTDSNTETHGGTTGRSSSRTRETQIAGYDSAGYADANSETETATETTTHGETVANSGQSSGTESLQYGHRIAANEERSDENERTRTARVHGNIGVTTSQQMLQSEMDIAREFWIYDYIASAFESDNFITCYRDYREGSAYGDSTI